MKSMAVFCGASAGKVDAYREAAVEFGTLCAREGIGIVYGGGKTGIMGLVAESALKHNGQVTGVITRELLAAGLALEGHYSGLKMKVTETMAERKRKMFALSDGFVALPGGYGTLDEIFEALTYTQLNLHAKPCAFLNTNGFYDHLLSQMDVFLRDGFISREHTRLVLSEKDPLSCIEAMRNYQHPTTNVADWVLEQLE